MSKVLYLLATDRSFYLIALGRAPKDADAERAGLRSDHSIIRDQRVTRDIAAIDS